MKEKKYFRPGYLLLYFLAFCLLFSIGIAVTYFVMYGENKTLIWSVDGIPQYLIRLQYTGQYLRTFLHNVMNGNYIPKMYDFTIGMGGDVRLFFKTEPITFASVLVKKITQLTDFYNILTILRMFLIGMAFSCYGFYKKKPFPAVLGASLAYTFSAFTFYQVGHHPQFAVGIILLPLLLIGTEQVMKKQNVLFFSLTVAISLVCNYYFLYINTIIMALYVLIRIRGIYKKNTINELFGAVFRLIGAYLLGCGMAAIVFLPTITEYFLSSREISGSGGTVIKNFLSYGADRLPRLFLFMVAPVDHDLSLTTINTSILAVPAVAMLFGERIREKFSLKFAFILGMGMLSVPFVGYVFSGFDQVVNRWSYAFIFLMAVIILFEFENFRKVNPVQFLFMAGLVVLYYFDWQFINAESPRYRIGFITLAATVALIAILRVIPKMPEKVVSVILCMVIALSASLNGYVAYAKGYGNLSKDFTTEESAEGHYEGSVYQTFADIDDDSFYRCDSGFEKNDNYNNAATALSYNGICLYNSTINKNEINYFLDGESIGISGKNRILSLDGRAAQEALACVKYYMTKSGTKHTAPYGFVKTGETQVRNESYDIYENSYTLPIGYTYSSYMKKSTYAKLNALEKQQAQLKCAIVEDRDVEDIFDEYDATGVLPYEVAKGVSLEITAVDEGISRIENGYEYSTDLKNEKDTASVEYPDKPKLHFSLPSKAGCEVYLRFVDLDYDKKDRTEVRVTTDTYAKTMVVRDTRNTYSLDRDDYLVNLGYYDKDETIEGTINFYKKGDYTWKEIEVYYVDMSDFENDIASLQSESLQNVKITDNTVTGTAELSKDQIMAFSINYDPGWTAYVDGEKTELYTINTMYMGLPLKAGSHTIELRYESCGIRIGAIISLVSIGLFLICLLIWIFKKLIGAFKKKEIEEKPSEPETGENEI